MTTSEVRRGVQGTSPWDSLFPNCRVALLETALSVPETTISLDPGRTTGMVIAPKSQVSATLIVAEVVELGVLWRVLHAYRPAAILFERFDAENLAANPEALDVRGVVKLFRDLAIYPRIYWQPREAQKTTDSISSDKALRANGLWVPGMGHGRAAMRHFVWHAIKRLGAVQLLEWTREDHQ